MRFKSRSSAITDTVEAFQWFNNVTAELLMELQNYLFTASYEAGKCPQCLLKMEDHGWLQEGGYIVCPGDWVITGLNDRRYTYKASAFELSYRACTSEEDDPLPHRDGMKLYQHYLGELFLVIDDCPVRINGTSVGTFISCIRLLDNRPQIYEFEEFHGNVTHEGRVGPQFRVIADPADVMPHGGHP